MVGVKLAFIIVVIFFGSLTNADEKYLFNSTLIKNELPNLFSSSIKPKPIITPIKHKGDVLLDAENKPIKLWGGIFRLTNNLLDSSREEKIEIINALHSIGFNYFRIVGVDFGDPGIYSDWSKNSIFPKEKMKNLCEFTELMKEKGIVYSIDINHIAGKFKDVSKNSNKISDLNKSFKYVELFDQDIIKQTIKWYESFLTQQHQGCKTNYANDPSFFYLNIVNEDSIYQAFYENFKYLSNDNLKLLNEGYRQYLHENYGGFDSQIKNGNVCTPSQVKSDVNLCDLTFKYFQFLELSYFSNIKSSIRNTGYNGIITTTNLWFGLHNQLTNYNLGDALATHIYFSPLRSLDLFGQSINAYLDYSFIMDPVSYKGWESDQLYKLPAILYENKPIFISEWNHSVWSDYLYEGAVLITALALKQDVSLMTIHTLFDRWLDHKVRLADSEYTVFGNPVIYALLPSLSKAFINSSYNDYVNYYESPLKKIDNLQAAIQGLNPISKNEKNRIGDYFKSKIRLTAREDIINSSEKNINSISISFDKEGSFILKTPVILAILGKTNVPVKLTDQISIQAEQAGAILFLALDDLPLNKSKSILVTTVSGFEQGERKSRVGFGDSKYIILNEPGKGPQYLKKNPLTLYLTEAISKKIKLTPILQESVNPLTGDLPSEHVTDKSFVIGLQNTPWYLLEFE